VVHGLLAFIWVGGYFVFRLVFVVVAVRVCETFSMEGEGQKETGVSRSRGGCLRLFYLQSAI